LRIQKATLQLAVGRPRQNIFSLQLSPVGVNHFLKEKTHTKFASPVLFPSETGHISILRSHQHHLGGWAWDELEQDPQIFRNHLVQHAATKAPAML
jgi:hypothetical protein